MNRAELVKNLHDRLDAVTASAPGISAEIDKVMESYIDMLVSIETGRKPGAFVEDIDFPDFVSDLIRGTFEAVVDATIQQMEAYAELLDNVTGSIDEFKAGNSGDTSTKDYLTDVLGYDFDALFDRSSNDQYDDCEKLKHLLAGMGIRPAIDCPPSEKQLAAIREALEVRGRQKLFTTMVLTGINRFVVSDENRNKDE